MGLKITHLKRILFTFLLFNSFIGFGQIVNFDGNNCVPPSGDEWGTPDVVDGDDTPTGTADILNFWFDQDNEYVYMAFDREATGNSSFSFFINTDCNSSTGDTSKGGSDVAAFFSISPGSNPVITDNTLYTWDGSMFVDTGVSFEAKLGEESCNGSLGLFFEIRIKITDIFDVCNPTSTCNNLTIEVGASLAGGSPNSSLKDEFEVPSLIGINSVPTAKFTQGHVCTGATVTLDGSNSTFYADPPYTLMTAPDFNDAIVLYEWDFEYTGIFSTDATGVTSNYTYTTPGFVTTALRVTDKYGCTDITTQEVCVFSAPQPKFTYSADASCGYSFAFDASISIDPTGGNDLTYEWDFSYDGNTFNIDAIGVNVQNDFDTCESYDVALRVKDPSTPTPCDVVIAFQTITVEDTTPPTGTAPGDILDLQCISEVPAGDIELITDKADNCGGLVTVSFEDTNNGGSGCKGSPYIVTRTYTLTDECGSITDLVQTIRVEDTTAPTGTAPGDILDLQCISEVPAG
ncbi:PKD domain-containing protein, partial [Tenacibaculum sp. S7007]|nr:PKD domain-containing protein [Tenacibaculum pelagium]